MGVWNNVPSPNSGGISSPLFDVKIEYAHATANSALYQQQFARLHKADQIIAETRIAILIPLQKHLLQLRHLSKCTLRWQFHFISFIFNPVAPLQIDVAIWNKVGALLTNNGLKFWNAPKLWSNSSLFHFEVSTRWWNVSNSSSLLGNLLYYFSYRDVFGR